MSRIIKLYCEGKKGSHDYDILEKVVDGLSPIQIEPIGSIRGAGAIIQYKETEVVKSDFKLLFRDRDFDKQIPDVPLLEKDPQKNYCYYSYRNTIENYLFNTSHFFAFITEKKLNTMYGIDNENQVREIFIKAAEHIRFYQAIRHTMGMMRTGETNFGTRWTEKSGILPECLDENYCKQKALEKIFNAKAFAESWTESGFEEILNTFLSRFDSSFMKNLDFLIFFQGKDFESSLKRLMPDFPMKDYYRFAKEHFDYTQFPDLITLRQIIENEIQN